LFFCTHCSFASRLHQLRSRQVRCLQHDETKHTDARYGQPSDVYSAGLVLAEQLFDMDVAELKESGLLARLRSHRAPLSLLSSDLGLVANMLRRDPARRPTAAVLCESLARQSGAQIVDVKMFHHADSRRHFTGANMVNRPLLSSE
jgi:hypothetical protein